MDDAFSANRPFLFSIAHRMLGSASDAEGALHRAKVRLAERRPQLTGTSRSRRAVAERFAQAFSSGNSAELSALLAAEVGVWSDGGGKAPAARHPLVDHDWATPLAPRPASRRTRNRG